ncbi:MAG: hypothetical protein DRN15_10620 [Thermoprotei archaeon]|nr:MAG: hypothetical protein DRN15_10620 [Thermoprotei archaeon]
MALRVLLVNDYKEYSGTERILKILIEEARRHGDNFKLCVPVSSRQFKKTLMSFEPDIVDFHNIRRIGILPLLYSIDSGVPICVTVHDYSLVCKNIHYFKYDGTNSVCQESDWSMCSRCPTLVKQNLPYPPKVFQFLKKRGVMLKTPSEATRRVLVRFGYPEERVFTVYHGVPLRDEKTSDEGYILYIGSKVPIKGRHIAERLSREMKQYKFVIVGSETGRAAYGEPGYVPEEELERLKRNCSLLLFPSLWLEPCGLVHLETMRYKKVVVGFSLGAVPEYVRHSTVDSLEEMKLKIEEYMEIPKLRRQHGLENYNVVKERFTSSKMYERERSFYRRVVGEV